MIDNLPDVCLMSKLSALKAEVDINFRLTGSRFFGTSGRYSDWDFFAEDSFYARSFLTSLRFKTVTTYKPDPTISQIFHWGERFSLESIHVQLIDPDLILFKVRAQDIIKEHNLASPCKSEMYIIWQAVIATLLAQRTESPVHS